MNFINLNKKLISVHLKNNPFDSESNASFEQWLQFFHWVNRECPDFLFIIVGNDNRPDDLHKQSNVVVLENYTQDFLDHVDVMAHTEAFMGMSSGPCNLFLLSNSPYVIFKHPGAHYKKMISEFGENNSFSFCSPHQHFLINYDKFDILKPYFKKS